MKRVVVVLFVIICGFSACGDGPSNKSSSSDPNNVNNVVETTRPGVDPDARTFFSAVADGVCDAMFDCPSLVFDDVFRKFESRTQCKDELVGPDFMDSELSAAFSSGRAELVPSKIDACVDSIVASICEEGFVGNARTQACLDAVSGQVAEGDRCATDSECEGQLLCWRDPDSDDDCDRTCEVDSCGGACGDGEYCDRGTCSPYNSTPVDQPCGALFECEGQALCVAGLCAPMVAVQEGEACHTLSFTFGAAMPVSPLGVCGPTFFCDQSDDLSGVGTCRSIRGEGESCTDHDECAYGLRCAFDEQGSDGQCAPFLRVGETCEVDEECSSQWCGVEDVCSEQSSLMCSVDG